MLWFYASFFILGISATMLGPTLSDLTARFAMPLDNGGIFITLHSTGAMLALVFVGRQYSRFAPRYLLALGPALTALGAFAIVAAPTRTLALAGALLFGLGFGSILIGPNILVAVLYPDKATARLNAVNLFFGLGAIAGPQMVNILSDPWTAYIVNGVAALALIPAFLRFNLPPVAPASDSTAPVNWVAFVPFAVLLFAYVGTDVGFSSWISTQMTTVAGSTAAVAALAMSLFFVGVTGGRALAIGVSRYLSSLHLLFVAISLMFGGAVLLVAFGATEWIALASAFIVGLGSGPIFPTTVAAMSETYPAQFAGVCGAVTALGDGGAMVIPWVQGQVGGGVSGGMSITVVMTLVMLLIVVTIERQTRAVVREVVV